MTLFEIILLGVLLLSWVFLAISARYNYVFGIKIIEVQNAIEDSLDLLDEKYGSLSRILEKPIFFNSPEVRQAIEDIGSCRDSILYVANILTVSIDESAIDDIEEGV